MKIFILNKYCDFFYISVIAVIAFDIYFLFLVGYKCGSILYLVRKNQMMSHLSQYLLYLLISKAWSEVLFSFKDHCWNFFFCFFFFKLLAITIQHEKPDLEEQKTKLLQQEEDKKIQLARLEESLLEVMSSQPSFLLLLLYQIQATSVCDP